jgi:hypothetical protein
LFFCHPKDRLKLKGTDDWLEEMITWFAFKLQKKVEMGIFYTKVVYRIFFVKP